MPVPACAARAGPEEPAGHVEPALSPQPCGWGRNSFPVQRRKPTPSLPVLSTSSLSLSTACLLLSLQKVQLKKERSSFLGFVPFIIKYLQRASQVPPGLSHLPLSAVIHPPPTSLVGPGCSRLFFSPIPPPPPRLTHSLLLPSLNQGGLPGTRPLPLCEG